MGSYGTKRNVPKRVCMQGSDKEDCFGRNRAGNCDALETPDYPCGACPFYKPARVFREECMEMYSRLKNLGRMDLIMKYGIRDYGLTGSWLVKGGRRRV